MPRKTRHHNTHLPRLQPLASALLAICIGVPSAQAVANTTVDLGLNQRHTAKAARTTPQTSQRLGLWQDELGKVVVYFLPMIPERRRFCTTSRAVKPLVDIDKGPVPPVTRWLKRLRCRAPPSFATTEK